MTRIKLNENELNKLIKESIQNVLNSSYKGNYDELIKTEMHNLVELERAVPEYLKSEIHSMVVTMESILQQIQRNRDFDSY